ncbi:MAG: RNA polymerase sigma factor [Chloroflexi bacterium]|nr:MAG: hypothetical protein CUN54_08555 [Phototrophicales bacterium]RMF78163.1 MAG: RNA polymerase sigma factor [Chloroflexota bacterium]
MNEQARIKAAINGDKQALEALIEGVRDDLYNLAVRMLWHPEDAEDATQEILVKIITKLSTFHGDSSFKTWAWRVAVNHLLNTRKRRSEQQNMTFDAMAEELDTFLAADTLPVESAVQRKLLIEEAKIGCMQAMLLCLKREERAAYVLGDIFGITDQEGAAVFEISPAAYRKRLSRARQRIRDFMNRKCGLYNADNPCRCSRRVQTNIVQGRINPDKMLFAQQGEDATVLAGIAQMDEIERSGALYRTHPIYRSPEVLHDVLAMVDNHE